MQETTEKLVIKPHVSLRTTDTVADSGIYFASEIGNTVSSALKLSLSFSGVEATNISIIVKSPEAVRLKVTHFNIERLKGSGTPAVVETEFTVDNRIPLTELELNVTASYDYMGPANMQTGVIYKRVPISMESYCYLVAPVKDADFKLTLEANTELPPLSTVFEGFIEASCPIRDYYSNPNVLSFLLNDGSISTLIVAKNGSKSISDTSQT